MLTKKFGDVRMPDSVYVQLTPHPELPGDARLSTGYSFQPLYKDGGNGEDVQYVRLELVKKTRDVEVTRLRERVADLEAGASQTALLRRLDEVEAENGALRDSKKSLSDCLDYWQARFVVLSDAWCSGNNAAVLDACHRFVKANDDAQANARLVEFSRLRERVAELENKLSSEKNALRLLNQEATERERLLMECVRWCVKNGASVRENGVILDETYCVTPPEHLAPLIAEAVKP